MSKLIITNPSIRKDCENILVFPFRMTLKVLLEIEYLDIEEIGYILFHAKAEDQLDMIMQRISNFRNLTYGPEENYDPEFSPDGLKIVYESRSQSVTDLIFMNIEDTSKTNLTESFEYVAKDPKFSPDGNKIIFHSTYGIYIVDLPTMNISHIIDDNRVFSAQFSPDGTKILFVSDFNIYLANADGGNLIQLTSNKDALNQNPQFQPLP